MSSHQPARNSADPTRDTASWLALVAAATVGAQATLTRVEITVGARLPSEGAPLRLIVQIYDHHDAPQGFLEVWAQPRSSAQRAVTPRELRAGVGVQLMDFEHPSSLAVDPVVVAWLEPGEPDLDLDAIDARPSAKVLLGVARLGPNRSVRMRLKRSRRVDTRRGRSL